MSTHSGPDAPFCDRRSVGLGRVWLGFGRSCWYRAAIAFSRAPMTCTRCTCERCTPPAPKTLPWRIARLALPAALPSSDPESVLLAMVHHSMPPKSQAKGTEILFEWLDRARTNGNADETIAQIYSLLEREYPDDNDRIAERLRGAS